MHFTFCRKLLLVVLGIASQLPVSAAACYTYVKDRDTCDGYTNSDGNRDCICAEQTLQTFSSLLNRRHPGVFLHHAKGNLLVSEQRFDSSTQRAPEQRIVSVAGVSIKSRSTKLDLTVWPQDCAAIPVQVADEEGNLETLEFSSERYGDLVGRLWQGKLNALSVPSSSRLVGKQLAPFQFGMAVELANAQLIVQNILDGGPAASAGIQIGDELLSLEFMDVDPLGLDVLDRLNSPLDRSPLKVVFRNAFGTSSVTLLPDSLSALARRSAEAKHAEESFHRDITSFQ